MISVRIEQLCRVISVKQITVSDPLYQEVLNLRHKILRVPLGLSLWQEDLSADVDDIILAACENEKVVGCVMLTPQEDGKLKLRQMAVDEGLQRSGIGRKLVSAAESTGTGAGFKKIVLHARFVAIPFYEKLGYNKKGSMFLEVSIPHILMEKKLS